MADPEQEFAAIRDRLDLFRYGGYDFGPDSQALVSKLLDDVIQLTATCQGLLHTSPHAHLNSREPLNAPTRTGLCIPLEFCVAPTTRLHHVNRTTNTIARCDQ